MTFLASAGKGSTYFVHHEIEGVSCSKLPVCCDVLGHVRELPVLESGQIDCHAFDDVPSQESYTSPISRGTGTAPNALMTSLICPVALTLSPFSSRGF